jgi:hypothetical protein
MLMISELLDSIYGDKVIDSKYDLILFMQGMLKTYMNALLFINPSLDIHLIARSLVEKTNIFADHSTLHVLNEAPQDSSSIISSDIILAELQAIEVTELTELEKQSIDVLVEQFSQSVQQQAIIVGMLHNIKDNEKLHWVSFLIKHFLYK